MQKNFRTCIDVEQSIAGKPIKFVLFYFTLKEKANSENFEWYSTSTLSQMVWE